jgi:hypothetical protein
MTTERISFAKTRTQLTEESKTIQQKVRRVKSSHTFGGFDFWVQFTRVGSLGKLISHLLRKNGGAQKDSRIRMMKRSFEIRLGGEALRPLAAMASREDSQHCQKGYRRWFRHAGNSESIAVVIKLLNFKI